jgi:hypothetical protein
MARVSVGTEKREEPDSAPEIDPGQPYEPKRDEPPDEVPAPEEPGYEAPGSEPPGYDV